MAKRFRNEKFYRKLSKKERRQFRINCDNDIHDTFKKIMNCEFISFNGFISGGFVWNESFEGHGYWCKISKRYNRK